MFKNAALKTGKFVLEHLFLLFGIVLAIFAIIDFSTGDVSTGSWRMGLVVIWLLWWCFRNDPIKYAFVSVLTLTPMLILSIGIVVASVYLGDTGYQITMHSFLVLLMGMLVYINASQYKKLKKKRRDALELRKSRDKNFVESDQQA